MRTLLDEQLARYQQIISPDLNYLAPGSVPNSRSSSHLAVIVPKLSFLSRLWDIDDIYGSGLGPATARSLGSLSHQFPNFYNLRDNKLTSNEIRLNQAVKDLIVTVETVTEGNFLTLYINPNQMFGGYPSRDNQPISVDGKPFPLVCFSLSVLIRSP